MDKIPDSVSNIINNYLALLRDNSIPIDQAYLFGSYSKGIAGEWSDIDIALASKVFTGNRFRDRDMIRKYTLSVSSLLEVIPFNINDFNEGNPLAGEIIRTGIKLI
ncbi:MAG TPA: nucleotidyltransferase domain-containing protein [Spirochaetota bacterium]|mgnify:CR=1 FL=1|nr:nucleotidyltransferase domain-containing protein [Spirochaetota bacterium]HQO40311.1 nucleotidyltransferase domain-containing protein [Spirochaetota bacterium]